MSLLKTEKLVRRHRGGVTALDGVSLSIDEGEAVAIMGRSGSGKSTLLQLLGMLDSPSDGSYYYRDEDVSGFSDRQRSRLRATEVGFVFQAFHLIPQLSILANVELPFLYHPEPQSGVRKKAKEALEKVGLGHRMGHKPSQLSGGEMQRAAIARALVGSPSLILADEPTGNLDSETEGEILDQLKKLNSEGIALVIVTHDELVAAICERTIVLKDGRVANATA